MTSQRYSFISTFALFLFASVAEAQTIIGDLNCIQHPTMCPDTPSLVYAFSTVTGANGESPVAPLTLGDDGNFYGTTQSGGLIGQNEGRGYGTVFQLTPGGRITTIWAFTGGSDGANPTQPLVKGQDGNLWGITRMPASIFEIARNGTFTSYGKIANGSFSSLVIGWDNKLYGTDGVHFYQFSPPTTYTILYDGSTNIVNGKELGPSQIVVGPDGYFYGFTGGNPLVFFKLSSSGQFTTVPINVSTGQQFTGGNMILASTGVFYGIGTFPVPYPGNTSPTWLFQADTSGNITPLVNIGQSYFGNNFMPLAEGSDGSLYSSANVAFSVSPGGDVTTLYPMNSFQQCNGPTTQMTFGPGGLYGICNGGPPCMPQSPTCIPSGAVFKLAAASTMVAQNFPQPFRATLDAIDPNNDTLRPFLPLPSLNVEWDPDNYPAFAAYSKTVNAFAADGVTPLIIRWHLNQNVGRVTFTVSDSVCAGNPSPVTCQNTGTFQILDPLDTNVDPNNPQTMTATPQQLPDGSYMAFALLQAPLDFVRPNQAGDATAPSRTITISATTQSGSAPPGAQQTLALTLRRPPVALLHGIWSSACTWKLGLTTDSRFITYAEDYQATNSSHFATNAHEPRRAIREALKKARNAGIAVTQADFIGHSMGGLLGRLFAGGYFSNAPYQRPENLNLGDMHKLITLDSPHLGSDLANALVDSNDNPTNIGMIFQGYAETETQTLCSAYTPAKSLLPVMCITCGAVQDLSVGSIALSGMPAVNVPSHVIVGRGGVSALGDPGDFLNSNLTNPLALGFYSAIALLAQFNFFGTNNHDLIVSEPSQIGDVSVPDQITDLDHTDLQDWAVHTTVTSEVQTNNALVNLLNAPITNSDVFGALPATPKRQLHYRQ